MPWRNSRQSDPASALPTLPTNEANSHKRFASGFDTPEALAHTAAGSEWVRAGGSTRWVWYG